MTKEEKQVLLEDICARLPYGVIVQYMQKTFAPYSEYTVDTKIEIDEMLQHRLKLLDFKPYLRPMSSMTDEEINEYRALSDEIDVKYGPCDFTFNLHHIRLGIKPDNPHECVDDFVDVGAIDFLNKHHFDYRGLIPMGLALEAPKDMYEIPHSTI